MKIKIIFYIVIIQLAIIALITTYTVRKMTVKRVVYIPGKHEVTSSPSGYLNFFYEPRQGTNSAHLSWLGKKYNYSIYYSINSDTLNQLNDVAVLKPVNTKRIITLGASYTFGSNVNTKDNYPSQLQKVIDSECRETRYEVINLGVFGYDLQYSVERMKIRGVKYDPDLVLWFVTPDNFENLQEAFKKKVSPTIKEDEKMRMQAWHLREISRYYKKDLVLLSMPSLGWRYEGILDHFKKSRPKTYIYGNIADVVKEKLIFPDNHPNEEGYSHIARDVFEYLKKTKLIECK